MTGKARSVAPGGMGSKNASRRSAMNASRVSRNMSMGSTLSVDPKKPNYNHLNKFVSESTLGEAREEENQVEQDGQLGKLFQFNNPDRYKTDQLKEQAMAFLVPGYLQYVYDIN